MEHERPQPTALLTRRAFVSGAAATAFAVTAFPAGAVVGVGGRQQLPGSELATGWIRTLYDVVMAEGLTPPAAARFYYAASLTMYEAAQPALHGYESLAGQLTNFRGGRSPGHSVDVSIVVSESVAAVALGLLPNASSASVARVVDHRSAVVGAATSDRSTVRRSVRHAEDLAERLLDWMLRDGYAEASTMPYTPPVGADLWRSTPPNFGTAIEPHWGVIRPAVLRSADEVVPVPPVPFSVEPGSAFHEQAMATYRQSSTNTAEQIAIARFWTDNPRLSGLPSGHWFLLLADLAETELALTLDQTLEGFVRLGVALHDAFLNCWTWKYRYNLLRPVTYVRDHIDPAWTTLVNTPQFPEYTSGHSVGSGAAEVVLTSLYGTFPFTDSTGLARGLPVRSFNSFRHAAEEAATSRLYGGIHYPMGIDSGLAQGREIGRLVDARLRTSRRRR